MPLLCTVKSCIRFCRKKFHNLFFTRPRSQIPGCSPPFSSSRLLLQAGANMGFELALSKIDQEQQKSLVKAFWGFLQHVPVRPKDRMKQKVLDFQPDPDVSLGTWLDFLRCVLCHKSMKSSL